MSALHKSLDAGAARHAEFPSLGMKGASDGLAPQPSLYPLWFGIFRVVGLSILKSCIASRQIRVWPVVGWSLFVNFAREEFAGIMKFDWILKKMGVSSSLLWQPAQKKRVFPVVSQIM